MGLATVDRLSVVADARPRPPREIAFLAEYGASADILVRAGEIAAEIGVSPDAALLGEGLVSEEFFYQALADRVGAPYHVGRVALDTTASPARALKSGIVYLAPLAAPYRAIASPRGPAIKLLLDAADQGRQIPGLAISSPKRLGALIRVERGGEIARLASLGLHRTCPELCARGEMRPSQTFAAAGFGLGMIALAFAAPWLERTVLSLLLWTLFSAGVWLRSAAAIAADTPREREALSDADLPVYTVVVAMYREGSVAPKLVAALDAFDYPKAKLDIKLAIECGDKETLTALIALRLPPRYEIVIAPPGAPRTKPRACNIALEAARGELLAVYDAEDEPAPDQLRKAAAGFAADPSLDALQGRLKIANAGDNWLTFMFAVEYAALFELINPGLCALDLPIALGGSTNHFRTSALRRVGGWDAWNVTEDADLGLRLARFGARVGALDSDTWEEAPNELGNWFRQRVRWQKGWMRPVNYFMNSISIKWLALSCRTKFERVATPSQQIDGTTTADQGGCCPADRFQQTGNRR